MTKLSLRRLLPLLPLLAIGCQNAPAEPMPNELTPEAMMARIVELGTPGPGHARLAPLVGIFDCAGEFWLDPSGASSPLNGTSVHTALFDGRYLQQSFAGTFDGKPFQGLGYTGFNNASGKYEGMWMDSMGTLIVPPSSGTVDATGKVITFMRTMDDPITGRSATTREVLTIESNDRHSLEAFMVEPDGTETRFMRFTYTRKE